jgi:hypothetical protein
VVEAAVTAGIAAIAGCWSIMQGVHRRLNILDQRQDRIEIQIAKDYVSRSEYVADQSKLEEHMIRIENKLDTFIQQFSTRK